MPRKCILALDDQGLKYKVIWLHFKILCVPCLNWSWIYNQEIDKAACPVQMYKGFFFQIRLKYVCTSKLGTDQYSTPIWWGTGESDTIMLLVIPCGDVLWCKIRWARIEIDRGLLPSIWCKWALSSKCVSGSIDSTPALSDYSEHVCPWPRNFIRVFRFQGNSLPHKIYRCCTIFY